MGTESREAVIVDVVRTAFGKRGGALQHWHPADLFGFAMSTLSTGRASTPAASTTSSVAASGRWVSRART